VHSRIKTFVLIGLLLAAPLAWAQPANDNIADAILLEGSPVTIAGTTIGSTIDTSDTPGGTCVTGITTGGVWYRVFGGGGAMSAQTCGAASYDTKLTVFSGTPGALVCVTGNDDFCGLQSRVEWASVPSESYYILVHGFSTAKGTFELTVQGAGDAPTDSDQATFRVTKEFTDGNPGEVTVDLDCDTGLILDQEKTISEDGIGVTFVVTDFDSGELNCNVTERPVAGYSADYQARGASANTDSSDSEDGCFFTLVAGGDANACAITNSPDPVDVVITKEWLYPGSADASVVSDYFELEMQCFNAEIQDGYDCGNISVSGDSPAAVVPPDYYTCKNLDGNGNTVFTVEVTPTVYPGGSCYVVETGADPAVEVDNGCAGSGQGMYVLDVSAGSGDSCTITNTVFFEGIPTLSQYGMALMALLMLGVGFVGFRRFA